MYLCVEDNSAFGPPSDEDLTYFRTDIDRESGGTPRGG